MAKFKFHWGHGIMIALASFMIFIVTLIVLAGNMGEMVEDNYYEKTLHYQDDIDAQKRANSLTQKPEIIEQANGFLIRFYESPQEGKVLFLRPNNSENDIREPLKLDANNQQLIHAVNLKNGNYEVSIRWKQNGQDYLLKKSINWKDPSS